MARPALNPVFNDRPESIFPTMSALARESGAVNLGQGFPETDGPQAMLDLAAEALREGPNQYAPVEGLPELRQAIARDQKRFYDLEIDPDRNVIVTSGATEALASCFLSFLNPGDEAIVLAPFYECYAPQIEAAGARLAPVYLDAPDWRLDADALERAIGADTKVIVINTPHNPLGKVMGPDELAIVADAARRHDLIVICDEVYEHLIFDGRAHEPLMTREGLFERCVRVTSAGKTFSVTGFRIGAIIGPARLVQAAKKAHQHLAYTTPGALQKAVAFAYGLGDDFYKEFRAGMQARRDQLAAGLSEAGFRVAPCEGTYFLTADISDLTDEGDAAFCRRLTTQAGVAAVPVSAFYPCRDDPRAPTSYARFCFAKNEDTLDEASRRVKAYFA